MLWVLEHGEGIRNKARISGNGQDARTWSCQEIVRISGHGEGSSA